MCFFHITMTMTPYSSFVINPVLFLQANVDFTQRKVEMLEEKVKKIREENKSLSGLCLPS